MESETAEGFIMISFITIDGGSVGGSVGVGAGGIGIATVGGGGGQFAHMQWN